VISSDVVVSSDVLNYDKKSTSKKDCQVYSGNEQKNKPLVEISTK